MADRYSMPTIRGDDPVQTFQLQSALLRQRQGGNQWAKALMQQGSSTAPVGSWVEGLARALQGAVGGYVSGQEEREGKESERQMLADMVGQTSQKKAEEAAQLAQAGVPGFQMPMPNPVAGQSYEQPTAPAGGGPEVVPQGMLQPAPQPAARPVNAEMIAALSGMAGQGNRTAAGALPGFQFQYQDTYQRERDARQEALAAAREARMLAAQGQETFAAPMEVAGPDGRPMLVRFGSRGGQRPVDGLMPAAGASPETFPGTSPEASSLRLVTNPASDPASPAYAAAFQRLYGERQQVQPDGTVITIRTTPPPSIRQPVVAGAGGPAPNPTNPAASAQGGPPSTTTQVPGGTITRTGAGDQGTLTEAQGKANMFGLAMSEGNRILAELKEPPSAAVIAAWRNLPEGAVNLGLSSDNQRYFNALRQFAAGVLRKETGAAFTPSELLDVQSRFFTMPGDSSVVQAQKARAREQAIAAMKAEIPGGFRGQIAPPAAPGLPGAQPPQPGQGGPVRVNSPEEAMRLPSGTPIQLPDGTMGRVP